MAEYIEREAAIKAIYESDPNGIRRTLGFNVGQIEEALRAVPAVSVPQWISVKDRLPDVAGMYIVTACDEWCSHGEGIWYDTVVVVAEYSSILLSFSSVLFSLSGLIFVRFSFFFFINLFIF